MKGRSTSLNVKKFSESSYFASKDHNLMTRLHTFDEVGLYACNVVSMGDLRNSSASAIDRLSRVQIEREWRRGKKVSIAAGAS